MWLAAGCGFKEDPLRQPRSFKVAVCDFGANDGPGRRHCFRTESEKLKLSSDMAPSLCHSED